MLLFLHFPALLIKILKKVRFLYKGCRKPQSALNLELQLFKTILAIQAIK